MTGPALFAALAGLLMFALIGHAAHVVGQSPLRALALAAVVLGMYSGALWHVARGAA
jgi:hypothetical protein